MLRKLGLASAISALSGFFCQSALAGGVVIANVPTLDEYALFGLTAVVGVAGFVVMLRRRK